MVNNDDSHLVGKTLEATDVMSLLFYFYMFLKLLVTQCTTELDYPRKQRNLNSICLIVCGVEFDVSYHK